MRLTPHFTLSELEATHTGLPNHAPPEVVPVLRALAVNLLEPIRVALGIALHVNNGYRNAAVNAAVGGADGSRHMFGEAADIWASGITPEALATFIVGLGLVFDQLIVEPGWVHISYREGHNRGEMLQKVPTSVSKTGYLPWAPKAAA